MPLRLASAAPNHAVYEARSVIALALAHVAWIEVLSGNMGPMLGPAALHGCTSIGCGNGFQGDGTELHNRRRTFQRDAWRSPAARRSIAPGFLSSKWSGEQECDGKLCVQAIEVNPDGSRPRASSPKGRFPSA